MLPNGNLQKGCGPDDQLAKWISPARRIEYERLVVIYLADWLTVVGIAGELAILGMIQRLDVLRCPYMYTHRIMRTAAS